MNNTSNPSEPSPTPKPILLSVMGLCALVGASTLPWMYLGSFKFGGFAWGVFGFELILLFGCMMTILVTMGRVRVQGALPMAIACLAGTILVGAVFGIHVDARALIDENPTFQPWVNRTLLFRLGSMGLLSMLATLDVYRRDGRSWGLVIRALVFGAPVFAALAWIKMNGLPTASSAGTLGASPSPVNMIIILLGGLILGVLFSIAGHYLISSFEVALPDRTTRPEKTNKKSS